MVEFRRRKVLVIGELNVDIVATGLRSLPEMGSEILAENCELTLGSASAIFATRMAQLGTEVTFVSQVGGDQFGDFCLSELRQSGISTQHVKRKAKERTGVTIALSGKRDRALVTYPGAVATLTAASIDKRLMKQHDHIHLTSYYLQTGLRPSFASLFRQAKAFGLTTSFDPNSDPNDKWDQTIDEVLEFTDVLFVNEREAKKLTRSETLNGALRALGEKVPCAVVKRGARGAKAIQNGKTFSDPGFQIKVVDTTGAGDSFDAGFMFAYLFKKSLAECLRTGNYCGALAAGGLGGTAGQPNQVELQYVIQRDRTPGRQKRTKLFEW